MILDEKIEVHNTSEDLGFESRSLCPLSFITTVVHISFRLMDKIKNRFQWS